MSDWLAPIKKFKHAVVLPILAGLFDLKGSRFRTGGCTFEIPRQLTTPLLRSRFFLHTYEARELRMIPRFIQAEDRVLEVGACLGVVSCVTGKRLRSPACHVVVEANPECVPYLTRNRDLNGLSFKVENCAIQVEGQGTYVPDSGDLTGGRLREATDQPSSIPTKTLEQLNREFGPFNVLICDIEGAELGVFEQSAELFKSYKTVMVELHDFVFGAEGAERCRQILRNAGLKLVASDRSVEVWQRNGEPAKPTGKIVEKWRVFMEEVVAS